MHCLLCLLPALTAFAPVEEAPKDAKVIVAPARLSLRRQLDEADFGPNAAATFVEILVTLPGRNILRVDATSKLKTFADDKGESLVESKVKGVFGPFPTISKNRRSMIVHVSSYSKAPSKGATKILVKGDLVVGCGTEETTTKVTEITFAEKTETKVGDLVIRTNRVKGYLGGIDFQVTGKLTGIKRVVITNDGKDVPTFTQGTKSNEDSTQTHYFNTKELLKGGKIKVIYFAKEELVTVPVDLSIAVGL
jgi:hypothetical protein